MFYYKDIGIWYILLTLLETTKQFVLLEEDNLHTLGIPYDSGDLFNTDEIQYFRDYKHNINDYSNIQEYAPCQREEREMQEYDDYRDEKDSPNLSKGGLGLFSWWKNEGESKRLKGGVTYPPISNEITNADVNTTAEANSTDEANATISTDSTVDPAAISGDTTDTNLATSTISTPAESTYQTTCVCYNVTEECIPLITATGVTCLGIEDSSTTTASPSSVGGNADTAIASSSNGDTTVSSITTTSSENTTAALVINGSTSDLNTTAAAAMSDTTAAQAMSDTTAAQAMSDTTAAQAMSDTTAAQAMSDTTAAQAMSGSTPSLNTSSAAAMNNTTTGQNTEAALALSGSSPGLNTTASFFISEITVGQNKTADLNAKSTVSTSDISNKETTSSSADSTSVTNASTGISMPSILNMFGGGVLLPVYEIPITPLVVINTTSIPTKKKKTFHRIDNYRDSKPTKVQLNNISSYNYDQMLRTESYLNKNNSMLNGIPYTVLGYNGDKPTILSDQTKKVDNIFVGDRIDSPNNILTSGQISLVNYPLLLNKITTQNQQNEVLNIEPTQTFLKPVEKYSYYHPIIVDQKLVSSNNKSGELIQNQRREELLHQPYNLSRNTLNVYNYSNPQSSIPAEPLNARPNMLPETYTVLKNNTQTAENKPVSDIKNSHSYFVKYNDTYLSENSNKSINLMDICKNVTCQGNNYLSQCCSRVCGPEKCQGEDFSYLHPIPAYFNTTINTTYMQYDPLLNTKVTNIETTTTIKWLRQIVDTNATQTTAKMENSTSSCSCSSKPMKSRVVRENDMKDFVKFQLMHGMTAPDSKEMMNALKEASLEIQKVNREFHSNEPGNIFKMNGNGQNIHLPINDNHTLRKKEPEGVFLPFSSNKILDDLRATISNSILQSNLKPSTFQKDRYRFIRNQGLKDQMESIRENNMILEKIKKETEMELQRLCLLETKRREEELLFDKKRENELKELKTIQDLIHREFESRVQGDSAKRAISDTAHKLIKQYETTKKGSVYSKPVKRIDNSGGNDDIDNFILGSYPSLGSNTSISFKPGSTLVDIEKFPELEINNPANAPHDDALLLLNIGPEDKQRKRREGWSNAKNKILKENIKSVHSTENNTGMLR